MVSAVCVQPVGDDAAHRGQHHPGDHARHTDAEIAAYVATGDPMDKAGAYAIQHAAFNPVAQMEGCYSAVMGLPLGDFTDLLAEFGVTVPQPVAPICRAHGAEVCCRRAAN
ncbi:MAG: Maf family protein [Caldilineaceae bacterium]